MGTIFGTPLTRRQRLLLLALLLVAVVTTAQVTVLRISKFNNTRYCNNNNYSSGNLGVKLAACIADLPSTGGTADASGVEGAQSVDANIWTGVTKNVMLKLGAGTYTFSVAQTPPTNSRIIGAGRGITNLVISAISGNNVTLFSYATGVTQTELSNLSIVGPGASHTVPCISYLDSPNNIIDNVEVSNCYVGVRNNTVAPSGSSSYGNVIRNSRIFSNYTNNIEALLETNDLDIDHDTFGGSPSVKGIYALDANSLHIHGESNCEGVTGVCIDFDSSGAHGQTGGLVVSGFHSEANSTTGCVIRLGNTATTYAISINGNRFSGGAGDLCPINAVRATDLSVFSNSVLDSGFTTSGPILGTVSGFFNCANNWAGVTGRALSTCFTDAWVSWTPTYSSDIGDAAATYSAGPTTTIANYKYVDKTLCINLSFSGTIKNPVTPVRLTATLPLGLLSISNNTLSPALLLQNNANELGYVQMRTDGTIWFNRTAGGVWTTNVAGGGNYVGCFEVQ